MAANENSKVLMIGIDAGDIEFIQSSLDSLPRLRQLIAQHPPLHLASEAETLSSSVWPTFSSGLMPGEHGIYYPMQWDAANMRLRRVTADWLAYTPFWSALAKRGTRVTVLDVPFSLPSELPGGTEVLNWGSQESLGAFSCSDPRLGRAIHRRFGHHPMGQDVPVAQSPSQLVQITNNLIAGARLKGELSRWLMQENAWDLFITVFAECHRGGHLLWPGPDADASGVPPGALRDVYASVDRAIGEIIDSVDLDNTTVIVFSVHGTAANYTQEHHLLPVLERINASFMEGRHQCSDSEADKRAGNSPNPIRFLRALVPSQAQQWAARLLPDGVRDWVVRRTYHGGLDWQQTPGFALVASCEGYLRYNLRGREAQGALEPNGDQLRTYAEHLAGCLLSLEDAASGQQLVKEVVVAADRYSGSRSAYLPDIIVTWNDILPVPEVSSAKLGKFSNQHTTGRCGDHRAGGFALLAGDQRRTGEATQLRHAADFAAFVSSIFAQPFVTAWNDQ